MLLGLPRQPFYYRMYPMNKEKTKVYKTCAYCEGTGSILQATALELAQMELDVEEFQEEVAREKAKLQTRRPWFPWRFKIVRV